MSLTTLPHDLQYTLLHTVATRGELSDLISLAQTSSSFYQIFQSQRQNLFQAVLFPTIASHTSLAVQLATAPRKQSTEPTDDKLADEKFKSPVFQLHQALPTHKRFLRFAGFAHNYHRIMENCKDSEHPPLFIAPPASFQDWVHATYTYALEGFPLEEAGDASEIFAQETYAGTHAQSASPALRQLKAMIDKQIHEITYSHTHPPQPRNYPGADAGLPPPVIIFYDEDKLALARAPLVAYVMQKLYSPLTGWDLALQLLGDEGEPAEDYVFDEELYNWEYWTRFDLGELGVYYSGWIDLQNLEGWLGDWGLRAWREGLERGVFVDEGLWYDVSKEKPGVDVRRADI